MEGFVMVSQNEWNNLNKKMDEVLNLLSNREKEANTIEYAVAQIPGLYLNVKQVADLLGWTTRTIHRKLRDPDNPVPMVKDGNQWIIGKKEFLNYVKSTRES